MYIYVGFKFLEFLKVYQVYSIRNWHNSKIYIV